MTYEEAKKVLERREQLPCGICVENICVDGTYVDADEAFELAIKSLEKQAEIVHCKECVHWCCIEQPNIGRCALAKYLVGANGFCVYGNRGEE